MTLELWPLVGATIAIIGLILAQGRFAAVRLDKRFELMAQRIDKQFDIVEKRFDAVDKRFEAIERQIGNLRNDVAEVRDRVSRVEGSVQTLLQVIVERPAA